MLGKKCVNIFLIVFKFLIVLGVIGLLVVNCLIMREWFFGMFVMVLEVLIFILLLLILYLSIVICFFCF